MIIALQNRKQFFDYKNLLGKKFRLKTIFLKILKEDDLFRNKFQVFLFFIFPFCQTFENTHCILHKSTMPSHRIDIKNCFLRTNIKN